MAQSPEYVGSETCAGCHDEQATAWRGSHHALAWTRPDGNHVLGEFDETIFEHNGITTRFFRREGAYFIETDGPDGHLKEYLVTGIAGIDPLQQYLVETEPGRVQALDVAWDTRRQRWYHLYPDDVLLPGNGFHWTGAYKTWNARCAECHATGFVKNYSPKTRRYQSRQAEIGVGCEACHGPGAAHIAWAKAPAKYDPTKWPGLGTRGLTIQFTDASQETEIQQCAGCHSRREAFEDGNPAPGTPFHDAYRLALLRPGLYHPDGTIQDEVYVYGSFLQSKMYAKGVRCTDCHDAHSTQRIEDGNAVCTQCHSTAGNPRFPSLPRAEYDDRGHHFHEPGTDGAQCKNCHMIERVYMGIDGRRDHSFRVPRPELSSTTGAPNACTDCHADRDAEWAEAELERRFPASHHRGPNFAQALSVGRIDPGLFAEDLLDIAENAGLPAIVRASALDLLAQTSDTAILARIRSLLSDEDPLVRVASISAFKTDNHRTRAQALAPLLQDPIRSVRIAAARQFLPIRIDQLPSDTAKAAGRAMTEWQASLLAKFDFPETQLVLGGVALTTRNLKSAETAFRESVRLDPQLVDGWSMIIRIRLALRDIAGARSVASEALAANPDEKILLDFARQLR